jgi:PHD/YefM family antitoxin component YafN of YafNO toxin-antitoxin module
MNQTNPKQLRAEMKDYLDRAEKEPIRIQRRAGGSCILMNESHYADMQNEILSLQRRLLGMSEIVSGKTTEYKPGDKSRLQRFSAGRKASSK